MYLAQLRITRRYKKRRLRHEGKENKTGRLSTRKSGSLAAGSGIVTWPSTSACRPQRVGTKSPRAAREHGTLGSTTRCATLRTRGTRPAISTSLLIILPARSFTGLAPQSLQRRVFTAASKTPPAPEGRADCSRQATFRRQPRRPVTRSLSRSTRRPTCGPLVGCVRRAT